MQGRLKAYTTAVATIGLALLALLAVSVDLDRLLAAWPLIVTLAAFLLVGQFLAIPLSRERRGPSVLVNSPFAFALALYGGIGAAAVLQAAAALLWHAVRRTSAAKAAFNLGSHTTGLAAGGAVWLALGGGRPTAATLPSALAGTAVVVALKSLLSCASRSRSCACSSRSWPAGCSRPTA
jgi:hypothetical protein